MAIQTLKYSAHPIAGIFPMMEGKDLDELIADIKKNGVLEPGILLDGLLLDGRNRQIGALKADRPFPVTDWNKLSNSVHEMGPVAYVISRNGKRRQLNASQKAAYAVESLPFFEAQAALEKAEAAKGAATPAPNGAQPKKKREKVSVKAARATGASARNVERAKKLKKKDPKKFAKVKAGNLKLSAALRDKKAEAKAEAKAKEAAKGLTSEDKLASVFRKASATGKLVAIIDGFKIVVTKIKPKIAKAKKK